MAHKRGWRRTVVVLACVLCGMAVVVVGGVYLVLGGFTLGECYTLNASTFDPVHLSMVAANAGITLPPGARGQNLYWDHSTCIDPSFWAKIEIPTDAAKDFAAQISKLPNEAISIGGSTKRPAWWQPTSGPTSVENLRSYKACVVRLILCHEQDAWVLYVEWFST